MADRGMDLKTMFRDDGSYDFKKREDWDYGHSYGYMAGWLGQEEAAAEKKRKRKMGKTDFPAPPLPQDAALVDTIEKSALHVHKSPDSDVFERLIREKNKGKPGWGFLEETGHGYDYYKFVRHCLDRKVEPRPLAQKALQIKEDREKKEANVRNNVFTAGSGAPAPKKEAVFKTGELMEVLGLKNQADFNGKIVRVLRYYPDLDRYEVKFEGGRYDGVAAKLREENLMYSAVEEKTVLESKELPEGEIPNGTKVEIRGLQSETARWLNGQIALVVQWDVEGERYDLRLEVNNAIKKVKPANIQIPLPAGWEEHYDEHLSRHYYINTKTQKVTWKHPTVANTRGKFSKVRENNAEELAEVEVDANRKMYDVDDEEEGEGGFDLQQLIAKVDEREQRREEAEDRGEDFDDSDDGMHQVVKKRKKKKKKDNITIEMMQERVAILIEETMTRRETMKKDFTMVEGNFMARDSDPVLAQFRANADNPSDAVMRATFEMTLGCLEKGTSLMSQLKESKLQTVETWKRIEKLTTIETPAELLEVAEWVAALLKTM